MKQSSLCAAKRWIASLAMTVENDSAIPHEIRS